MIDSPTRYANEITGKSVASSDKFKTIIIPFQICRSYKYLKKNSRHETRTYGRAYGMVHYLYRLSKIFVSY